jgi:hypothetical protein
VLLLTLVCYEVALKKQKISKFSGHENSLRMASSASEPHGAVLSESLRRLQLQAASTDSDISHDMIDEYRDVHTRGDSSDVGGDKDPQILPYRASNHTSNVREGYGFRPVSGASTPVATTQIAEQGTPLPDPNGLGWPGVQFYTP